MSKPRISRLWLAVIASRLLVMASGWLTAWHGHAVSGWQMYDPGLTSSHLGAVGNVLAAPFYRFDAVHYLTIAQHGYSDPSLTAFFPLYPLLIRALSWSTGSAVAAGVLISNVALVAAVAGLYRLTTRLLGAAAASATVLLLCFSPFALFLSAVYTESLFLALSVWAVELAFRDRWAGAALLSAAASVSRVPGVLTIAPVLWIWWQSEPRPARAAWWFALAPLPLLAFAGYLTARGYGPLAFVHAESSYRRVLLTPPVLIVDAVWQPLRWTWFAIHGNRVSSLGWPARHVAVSDWLDLLVLAITLTSLYLSWRRLPRALSLYATLVLCVLLSDGVSFEPLLSFNRYVLTVFPLWMVAGDWLMRRRLLYPVLILSACALCFYTIQFARWTLIG